MPVMFSQPKTIIIDPEQELYQPQYTTSEVMGAYYDMAHRQTTLNSLYRSSLMSQAQEQGEKLDPEEINKRYNINAKEPMTESAAFLANEAQQDVMRLQNIISNGPQTLWGGTIPGVASAIVGGMNDPIDFALGWAVGGVAKGVALGIKAAQTTSTFGAMVKAAKVMNLTRLQAFSADVVGNIVSNGITEAFNYKATTQEQMEIAADEVFRNVVLTSFAFTGAMHGAGAVFSKLARMGDNAIIKLVETAELAATTQHRISDVQGITQAVLLKDMEIDAPLHATIRNVFPEDANVLLKEGSDAATIRKFLLEQDPDTIVQFRHALEDSGFEMRKTYLFDEEVNPVLPAESIRQIEAKLAGNDLDPQGLKDLETPEIDPNQKVTLDMELERLKEYDVEFDNTKPGYDDFAAYDNSLKKSAREMSTEMEAFKSFAACVLGAGL